MGSQSIDKFFLSIVLFGAVVLITAGPAGAQSVKVKIGTSVSPPSLEQIKPFVAIEKGFFSKYGLDVQLFEFRGDALSTKALLAGELDVLTDVGATSAIVSASKGAKIRVWVVPQPLNPYHFVARKEAVTALKDLVGKTVAVSAIGAISYHIPRIVLERSGVDADKVRYVALGSPPDRLKALIARKVDATMVTNTEAAKLVSYPDIVDLMDVAKVLPEIPQEFSVARSDYIQKNPETMYKLAKAVIETNRWIVANKEGTIEVAMKIMKDESPEILRKVYDMIDPHLWGVNGDMSESSYTFTVDFLKKVGYMTKALPYNEIFDRRFVDRALKELGRK